MSRPKVQVSVIGDPLPEVEKPFAVLVDASDEDWTDGYHAEQLIKELLNAGCRYFVCFGPGAEAVHDRIDDVIVEHEYDGITTTFHEDESQDDVAEFFNRVAVTGMKGALVLVRDLERWKALL